MYQPQLGAAERYSVSIIRENRHFTKVSVHISTLKYWLFEDNPGAILRILI